MTTMQDSGDKITAPFTDKQVAGLNAYQRNAPMHPFTCVTHSNEPLVAVRVGWRCRHCDYRQYWAWAWMADTSWWENT